MILLTVGTLLPRVPGNLILEKLPKEKQLENLLGGITVKVFNPDFPGFTGMVHVTLAWRCIDNSYSIVSYKQRWKSANIVCRSGVGKLSD